jgi:hypothetical protein
MQSTDCYVELNTETGEGHILIPDQAEYPLVQAILDSLAKQGWLEVDPDDAVEPHEFEDGSVGVKSYLYKDQEVQEVSVGVAASGR